MKIARVTFILAALAPAFQAGAVDLAINSNPYTPIVTRNIFGLVPIPTNAPAIDPASLVPPPKITPNGIMTIFGIKEALYKVALPAKPGKPAADQAYTFSEGEGQDDIEVVKIDDQADVITFNNHGVIQELPLVAAAASEGSPGPSTPSSGPAFGGGHFPRPVGAPGFAGRRGLPVPNANTSSSPGDSGTPSQTLGEGSSNPQIYNPGSSESGLSPEAEALLIEKNYLDAKNNPNSGPGVASPSMFPPTPLRGQSDASGEGNQPQ